MNIPSKIEEMFDYYDMEDHDINYIIDTISNKSVVCRAETFTTKKMDGEMISIKRDIIVTGKNIDHCIQQIDEELSDEKVCYIETINPNKHKVNCFLSSYSRMER